MTKKSKDHKGSVAEKGETPKGSGDDLDFALKKIELLQEENDELTAGYDVMRDDLEKSEESLRITKVQLAAVEAIFLDLFEIVKVWWGHKKPLAWSFLDHLEHPFVKCSDADKPIAQFIADTLIEREKSKKTEPKEIATVSVISGPDKEG